MSPRGSPRFPGRWARRAPRRRRSRRRARRPSWPGRSRWRPARADLPDRGGAPSIADRLLTPRDRAGRVLLVEDSEGGAQLMRIAFGERLPDAKLEIFADGERALAALDEGHLSQWDLV